MHKFLLTTALVLPLSMGAAFAQETKPEDPATDAATAPVTEAPADPAAAPADPAAAPADPAAAPTAEEQAAEQEAMAAEVAASGKVAQQQAANELRLDWITDAAVTSPDGGAIGDINDLIVDGDSGQMIAAIIGVGGFLGIGEKQIAVPWDQLTVNYDAQQINSDLTKEEAEAAPEYVFREREAAPSVAPADGATAPAAPATDGAAAPADSTMATPPADPAAAPAEGTMPAADAAATPEATDGTAEPMEGEEAPAEGEQPASN